MTVSHLTTNTLCSKFMEETMSCIKENELIKKLFVEINEKVESKFEDALINIIWRENYIPD